MKKITLGLGMDLKTKELSAITLNQNVLLGNILIVGKSKEANKRFVTNIVSQIENKEKSMVTRITESEITVKIMDTKVSNYNGNLKEDIYKCMEFIINDVKDGTTPYLLVIEDMSNVETEMLDMLILECKRYERELKIIVSVDSVDKIGNKDNFKTAMFFKGLDNKSIDIIYNKSINNDYNMDLLIALLHGIPSRHYLLSRENNLSYVKAPYIEE